MPVHPERVEHDGAERQRPPAGIDRAGQVARSRIHCREHETGTRTAGPTAESGDVAKLVTRGPEDSEVQHVAPDAQQRELVVGRADVDPIDAHLHIERHVRPLVDAELEAALEGENDAGVGPQRRHGLIIWGVSLRNGYGDANSGGTVDV